ncbi:MAG: hypothetical protein K9G46_15755 [Flavobacteriales bacterium]|nr:hypothetical protein [Flavobacteriales bacterium]
MLTLGSISFHKRDSSFLGMTSGVPRKDRINYLICYLVCHADEGSISFHKRDSSFLGMTSGVPRNERINYLIYQLTEGFRNH